MNNLNLVYTSCPICGLKNNYDVLYPANFDFSDLNENTFSARRLPDKVHFQIVKCCNDGLVRSNPTLNTFCALKLYERSKFNYSSEMINLTNTYLKTLFPVLKKIKKNDAILEIGCGNGFLLNKLQKLGYKNIYGVEPSIDAIEKSNQKIKDKIKHGVLKIKLIINQTDNLN